MVRGVLNLAVFGLLVAGCQTQLGRLGGADGGDAGEESGSDGADGADDGDGGGNDPFPEPSPCEVDADCNDNNECSAEVCDAGLCAYENVLSRECRPRIDVEFPQRGATISGNPGSSIDVEGVVSTGAGAIQNLTLNGNPVEIANDGSFRAEVTPNVGGNVLVFETEDQTGLKRKRVQSFLYGSKYRKPAETLTGMQPDALMITLGQEVIDDGTRDMPANDLASLLYLALESFDINDFLDPNTPMLNQSGYDVYLQGLQYQDVSLELTATNGGIHLTATIDTITGDLFYDCVSSLCWAAGGDSTGGLSIAQVGVQGDLKLDVSSSHDLDLKLTNVTTMIDPDNVDVWSDNWWTDFLLGVVEYFVGDSLTADIADQLNTQIYTNVGPLLGESLANFDFSTTFELPSLQAGGDPIAIDLITDWSDTDFSAGGSENPAGGVVVLRGGAFVDAAEAPYDNLGIPDRGGCGTGESTVMPRQSPIEIGIADDMKNQLLYAAWREGMLEFDLPKDPGGTLFSDLEVSVSALLAPTANDCNDEGKLLAIIGDIRIDASLVLQGEQVDFTAYSTMAVPVEMSTVDGAISLAIPSVEWIQTELTVEQDAAIELEETLITAVESKLEEELIGKLSGGVGAFPIPEIDLSDTLGFPPGTAYVKINVDGITHEGGVTVVSGHL